MFAAGLKVNEPTPDHAPQARLSPQTVSALRDALRQWLSNGDADDSSLGAALRAVATEAKERGIRAEELLVTLKTTWFEVGGSSSSTLLPSPDHRRLDELVTACIKAYYGLGTGNR